MGRSRPGAPPASPDFSGDVIANFFPDTLQLLRDLSSGEKLTFPLELRRLTAGKSRAVYDYQPTRHYLLKLSVAGRHGRELEATQSLPTMTPETFAFQPYFTKLFWARESTEYLVLIDTSTTEGGGLEQAVLGYRLPGRGDPGGGHPGLRGQNLASESSGKEESEGPPYHGEAWACGGLAGAF